MTPKVSVIVPVYNAEATLVSCVDSLRRQTLGDLEIWLVNDGSTDESLKMCKGFAESDPRIQVLQGKCRGPGDARNTGIRAARGAYIGFVDADDTVEPDMFTRLYEVAVAHRCEVASCGFDVWEGGLITPEPPLFAAPVTLLTGDEIRRELLPPMMAGRDAAVWNKLFRRTFLHNNHISFDVDLMWGEDFLFSLRAMMAAERIGRLRQVFYHYIIRPGSLSQVNTMIRLRQAKKLYRRKAELITGGQDTATLTTHNNTWLMHHVGRAVDAALRAGQMDHAINLAADWRSTTGPVSLNDHTSRRRYRMLCRVSTAKTARRALELRLKDTTPVQAAHRLGRRMLKQ